MPLEISLPFYIRLLPNKLIGLLFLSVLWTMYSQKKPIYDGNNNKKSNCRWDVDLSKTFGSSSHSIMADMQSWPENKKYDQRQWILNLGQCSSGSEHWILRNTNSNPSNTIQFGSDGGGGGGQ